MVPPKSLTFYFQGVCRGEPNNNFLGGRSHLGFSGCGFFVGTLFLRVAPPWSQIEGLNHVLADPTLIRWVVPSAEEEENEGE